MAIRLPSAVRNVMIDALTARLDAGSGPATIDIRSGAQPATAADAASGTLLATLTLNDPSFSGGVNGVATLDVTPAVTTTGVAAGTAGWFRAKDSTGTSVLDGSCSASGGGGDLILATTTISVGVTVEAISGTLTMPG